MSSIFDSPQYIPGVGPKRVLTLKKLNIHTIYDLLNHFPSRYIDRSTIKKIADLNDNEPATIQADVVRTELKVTKGGYRIFEAVLEDDSGRISAIWFNQQYLQDIIKPEIKLLVSGAVKRFRRPSFNVTEFEIINSEDQELLHTGRVIPVYPSTTGLSQKIFRKIIKNACEKFCSEMEDPLPKPLLLKKNLLPLSDAIRNAHYPESIDILSNARRRLKFQEFFLFETAMALRKNAVKKNPVAFKLGITDKIDRHIRARFPFKLTRAQERVILEIKADLQSEYPMNRLLQGDVGSGKTAVAIYAMLSAVANGTQAAIMAPTEILAEQHFHNISSYLAGSNVSIALLTGQLTKSERAGAFEKIASGSTNLIIGTHALLEEAVKFNKLAVVVIDEQHKFGVMQRTVLMEKGINPHVLVMTATPIPRTLALTVFGNLDVSVIDELPPGRKPVKTFFRHTSKLANAFEFIRGKIKEGRQVYFVYPLIDESDKLTLKSATQMSKYLSKEAFPEFKVQLLHGAMKPAEKDAIMNGFREGKINILVSTVVIEVGIDVPNASIMVIDHAERYGLSQLHQLRGRIGRGAHTSFCVLFGNPKTDEAKQRLAIMEETTDGFRIAEEDLRIRGPGEFFGTKQSGLPEFRIANIVYDYSILEEARKEAFELTANDPELKNPDNARITGAIELFFRQISHD
ncbi:MAG: ATP-dependent DNA helicase RecG [Planctomycetes bacterium]|nr:ATP-dependent DNA helicase RecG [Planctomycetota bacterium]